MNKNTTSERCESQRKILELLERLRLAVISLPPDMTVAGLDSRDCLCLSAAALRKLFPGHEAELDPRTGDLRIEVDGVRYHAYGTRSAPDQYVVPTTL